MMNNTNQSYKVALLLPEQVRRILHIRRIVEYSPLSRHQQRLRQSRNLTLRRFLWLIATVLSSTTLMAADTAAQTHFLEAPVNWQSAHFQDHPLVGTIWHADGRSADWQELTAAVQNASQVLIGEVHPNPDHHQLQASILASVIASGKQPAVVWEMIPFARQDVLDDWTMAQTPDAATLGKTLEWSASGWPAWELYQPIAHVAARHHLKMIGTALPRETMMNIGRHGTSGIEENLRASLHLDIELDKQALAGLMKSLREGHCDLMPDEALTPMSLAQRARDGAMADAMLKGNTSLHAVLIAGNGHIRKDWGVAGLLSRLSPEAKPLSIAQIEVQSGETDLAAYIDLHDAANGFDFFILTPRSELKDHCAELRKKFGKVK